MSKRHIFTPEQEQEMVDRYVGGETCQKIAIGLSLSNETVKRILVKHDVYEFGRRFEGRMSPAQKAEMVQLYLDGATQGALGKRYGCERTNIHRMLRAMGVKTRPHVVYPLPDGMADTIRAMRVEGLNFKQIAARLEVPHHRVLAWALEAGITEPLPRTGENASGWQGGRRHDSHGYVHIRLYRDDPLFSMALRNQYAAEHRIVVARSLGRPLTKSETVHHINGDRTDNRLENLQLRQGKHGKGAAYACLDCGSLNVGPVPLSD